MKFSKELFLKAQRIQLEKEANKMIKEVSVLYDITQVEALKMLSVGKIIRI